MVQNFQLGEIADSGRNLSRQAVTSQVQNRKVNEFEFFRPNKTVRIETLTWDSGGGQKRTKSYDGWSTAIDKINHRNLVGLISANYCSDAK
jgi:hypothetical protein